MTLNDLREPPGLPRAASVANQTQEPSVVATDGRHMIGLEVDALTAAFA